MFIFLSVCVFVLCLGIWFYFKMGTVIWVIWVIWVRVIWVIYFVMSVCSVLGSCQRVGHSTPMWLLDMTHHYQLFFYFYPQSKASSIVAGSINLNSPVLKSPAPDEISEQKFFTNIFFHVRG